MKKQIGLFTAILFAVSTLMIACKVEVHTHTFSSKWTSDETNHWHAATCKHKDEVIDRVEHTFGDWTITKEPTEEAEGSREKSCTVCEYTVPEVIEKLPHTHKFAIEWTKDETNHWHAATCKHKDEVINFEEHSFGEWTVTKEATEESEGCKERTCTVCGYKATEAIEKLAHTHKFAESLTKDETHHWYAATCEHTTEVSEKAEHTFGNWTTTKEATEEADGSKERTCTVCGYKATEVIEKLAHTHKFATEWTSDETNHWHASTCGHEVTDSKTAHTFGDWTTTKEATCTEEGNKTRTCEVCKKEVTEKIDAKGHNYSETWTSDAENHWHASTCGHEVTEGKTAHTFGDWTITKEPTEETEGSREKSCSVCEYTVPEVIAKLEHTHKFAKDWTKDETNHWHASTCGHEVTEGKTAHTFGDWTTTKEATCTEEGNKTRTCEVCKKEVTEKIDAKGHNYSETWTSDAENHWHASTCGHEVTDSKAEHSFVNEVCTICEYSRIPEGFVLIPAGTFQMGSEQGFNDAAYITDANKPVHEVIITKPFYMGKYEVTQAEYEKYCSYTGDYSPDSSYGDGKNYPAYYVSWYDALVYCNKRSIDEGLIPCYSISGNPDPSKWGSVPTSSDGTWDAVECNWNANGYRLPTEAEWEYAARAGDNTVDAFTYSGTSDVKKLGDYAWYSSNSGKKTHEVGTKEANAFGLYDMTGNVNEWCWNWMTSEYDENTEGGNDPIGASSGSYRVGRGGCWDYYSYQCVVFCRYSGYTYSRNVRLGFRLVRASSK